MLRMFKGERYGKVFVLLVKDHEEYILGKTMQIIVAAPGFDHIVSSHPCNTLVFLGLGLRLKERTVHRNGELISYNVKKRSIAKINESFGTTLFCSDQSDLIGIKMLYQSKLQEKSKNIDMVFSRYNGRIILSVLLKEGLSRVKNNTV